METHFIITLGILTQNLSLYPDVNINFIIHSGRGRGRGRSSYYHNSSTALRAGELIMSSITFLWSFQIIYFIDCVYRMYTVAKNVQRSCTRVNQSDYVVLMWLLYYIIILDSDSIFPRSRTITHLTIWSIRLTSLKCLLFWKRTIVGHNNIKDAVWKYVSFDTFTFTGCCGFL